MAPRTWLKLSNATGDARYFEYADKEYWATVDYLFSEEHGLFFRDSRYFDAKSDNGNSLFWSRGNGWSGGRQGLVALVSAVDSDGMVHWVQHVGNPPDPVQESDTQLYGVGAFLLAASEITRWQGAETADNVDGLMARF